MSLSPTAILIPSLNRPQRLRDLVANIHSTTPDPHTLLFCVSDEASMDILDNLGEWYLDDSDGDDRRYVTRMNKLINYLDDAGTMFFGSDDVRHHRGWLTAALSVMTQGPSCVVMNDMHNPVGTQALITREYLQRAVYDAPGLAFHPDYFHNFADNEMFWTASVQGEYAHSFEAVVEHLHPVYGGPKSAEWDETYANARAGWEFDQALWLLRHEAIAQTFAPAQDPVLRFG